MRAPEATTTGSSEALPVSHVYRSAPSVLPASELTAQLETAAWTVRRLRKFDLPCKTTDSAWSAAL